MKAHNLLGPLAFSMFVIGESQDTFKINFKVLTGNDRRDLSFSDKTTYIMKRFFRNGITKQTDILLG